MINYYIMNIQYFFCPGEACIFIGEGLLVLFLISVGTSLPPLGWQNPENTSCLLRHV